MVVVRRVVRSRPKEEEKVADVLEMRIDIPEHLKILVYGDSEVGKTVFGSGAKTNPEMPPFGTVINDVLFCDVDGGMSSLVSHGILVPNKFPKKGRLTTLEQLQEVPKIARELGVRLVTIDTLTRLQFELMRDFMRNYKHKLQDWGYIRNVFSEMCSELLDLGCHVICTAHVDEVEDVTLPKEPRSDPMDPKKTIWVHPTRYQPALQGAMRRLIKGFFDVVGFYRIDWDTRGSIVRKLHLEPSPNWVARNRLNLPGVIKNPDFPSILQTWNESRTRLLQVLGEAEG